jgi:hypothetical protein
MCSLPILRRQSFSDPPPEENHSGEIIAGSIIGIIGVILLGFYLWEKWTLWYKRTKELRKVRESAIEDQEAALGSVGNEPMQKLSEVSPRPVGEREGGDEVDSSEVGRGQGQQLNSIVQDAVGVQPSFIRPRRVRATPEKAIAPRLTNANNARPDLKAFPVLDLNHRPEEDGSGLSDASLHDVRDSHVEGKTVGTTGETGVTFGTTRETGDAIPTRVAIHRVRSRSW